jgi:hypothetical protein
MLCSWGDMAVAVTNCRREGFRDIGSLHAEQLTVLFLFRVLHRIARKGERASLLRFASREIRAELIARKTASLN